MARLFTRHLHALWCLLGLLGLPACLAAQGPADRARIEAYHHDLLIATTAVTVDSLAGRWRVETRGSLQHLGMAFAGLRRFDLGDTTALYPAWKGFSKVVTAEPRWPWARLGLGTAALALYRTRSDAPSDYDGGIGGTHFTGFVLQMKRILQQEPDFAPALALVTRVMTGTGDRDEQKALLRVLQSADAQAGTTPAIQLVLARSARIDRRLDDGMRYLEQYARWGGDRALAQLEIARMLAGKGQLEEAAAAWYAGISTASPLRRPAYRADLEWIAEPGELERFDAVPDDSLVAFAERFWRRRDASDLRDDGDRLQEHLRRWDYVHQHFRVPVPDRRTQFRQTFRTNLGYCLKDGPNTLDDLGVREPSYDGGDRSVERVLDHRALVYMRHGTPLRIVGGFEPDPYVNNPSPTIMLPTNAGVRQVPTLRVVGTGGALYAAWLYVIEGEPRVFYFQPDGALGLDAPRALVMNQLPNLDMLLRLQDAMPGYAKLAARRQVWNMVVVQWRSAPSMPLTCLPGTVEVIQELRESAVVAMRTDTYQWPITESLDAAIQAYAVGRPGRDGRALVAFAIPAAELVRDSVRADSAWVTVRFEAVALDSGATAVARRDTTIQYVLPTDQSSGWISGLMEVPLGHGATEVRAMLQQGRPERGMLVSLPIAPPVGDGLGMSDIVIGRTSDRTEWRAPDRKVAVSALIAMSAGEPLELYYELYGLDTGQEYRTTLSLDAASGGNPGTGLSFVDQAVGTRQAFTRRLAVSQLAPGDYTLSITVEPVAGGTILERQRRIRVLR